MIQSPEEMSKAVFERFVSPGVKEAFSGNAGVILFPALCCVRMFDSSMMKKLAGAYAPNLFETWEIEDFGELLFEYKQSQLLVWERGYAIDGNLRQVTENYLREVDLQRWKKVHTAALDIYGGWLERPVDIRPLYVVEELFHKMKLGRRGEVIRHQLRERLDEYQHYFRDPQMLKRQYDNTFKLIQQDKEMELLDPDLYKEMCAIVNAYIV